MVTPRLTPVDFAGWPISYKEMNMYYNIAEDIMKVNKNYYLTADFLLDRLRQNGFPEADNKPVAVNIHSIQRGEIRTNPPDLLRFLCSQEPRNYVHLTLRSKPAPFRCTSKMDKSPALGL